MTAIPGQLFFTETVLMDPINLFYGNAQYNPLGTTIVAWSNVGGGGFVANVQRRARGVPGLEAAILLNDILGSYSWQGFDGSSFTPTRATIVAAATEDWALGATGTRISVSVTPLGAAALAEALRVDGSVTVDDVRIMVFDVTGAALKRVSRGVADSGGVGFRVLRIPN